MKITLRKVGGEIIVLSCHGPLEWSRDDLKLGEVVKWCSSGGVHKFLVNLEDSHDLSSDGIGELVTALVTTSSIRGQLKLCGLSPKSLDILAVTQMREVFEIHENEEVGLQSFTS